MNVSIPSPFRFGPLLPGGRAPIYSQLSLPNLSINNNATISTEDVVMQTFPYMEMAFFLSLIIFLFEKYLDHRQIRLFRSVQPSDGVPAEVAAVDERGEITAERFQKSVKYGLRKATFGVLRDWFGFIQMWTFYLLGYYPYLWDLCLACVSKYFSQKSDLSIEMYTSYSFILISYLIGRVISLPFSLYSTFVIEEEHGFNQTTPTTYITDIVKEFALVVLFSPVVSGMVFIIRISGPYFFFYLWLFVLVVQVFMMTIYPVLIAPLFNDYQPLEPEAFGNLKSEINSLAQSLSFPLTKIFVVDGSKRSSHSNAYLYGFFNVSCRICLYLHYSYCFHSFK